MSAIRVMCIFGTRPEAIKMAPVIARLKQAQGIELTVCVTAQHREMLDQVLHLFDIEPEIDLDVMRPAQDPADVTSAVMLSLRQVFAERRPDRVLIHGDTTTTLATSLAAYYAKIPVGHVEAGLRTGDIYSPWPEEVNRRVASIIADMHFAPTALSKRNLLAEQIPTANIYVTGNTVIDALLDVSERIRTNAALTAKLDQALPKLDPQCRIILVTGHRRESFGEGFEQICQALRDLSAIPSVDIVYPVHLNPNVREPVHRILSGISNVHLIPPLEYMSFVRLMMRASLILTDSGGIQEEAPSLGKPVLVMRRVTERPEAIEAGTVRLVGPDRAKIVAESRRILEEPSALAEFTDRPNPYGDGHAAVRIVAAIRDRHGIQ